jgi:hypothetical protein
MPLSVLRHAESRRSESSSTASTTNFRPLGQCAAALLRLRARTPALRLGGMSQSRRCDERAESTHNRIGVSSERSLEHREALGQPGRSCADSLFIVRSILDPEPHASRYIPYPPIIMSSTARMRGKVNQSIPEAFEDSRQSAIEMDIASINKHVLTGDVGRFGGDQENYRGGDFLRRRHSLIQGNLGHDTLKFLGR